MPNEVAPPYGAHLVVAIDLAKVYRDAGQGKILAIGPEVRNYTKGPLLEVGQVVLFRGGTQVQLGEGDQVVYVAFDDILAVVPGVEVDQQ